MKIIIVGGVAGGASAAARLRRVDEQNEIIIFERGEYISFANCGLPYHIGGTIPERESLLVQTVEGMKERFNIDIHVKTEIVSIDRNQKTVTAKNLKTGVVFQESYDKLLLSPGAAPFVPPIPGVDNKRVFTLRNMSDMDRIIAHIKEHHVKRAAVIGAGFIGVEMAENLVELGIKTSLIEMADQVLAPVDFEFAVQVHHNIREHGVDLYLKDGTAAIKEAEGFAAISLQSGAVVEAELIIMAIGVRPENTLAKNSGLELGKTGGINVDSYLQTSDKNIYAVGDAIEVKHYITGEPVLIPLAWPANRQGRIVADNMLGVNRKEYHGTLGTSILKAFDYTVSATGLNEKILKRSNIEYLVATVNRNSHAGYYPGAIPMTLKVIFTPEGKILGAQGIGFEGVDKRIDVIATAIKGGLSVIDLQDLELAYAPPYNSAKDPVNILGYVAENILNNHIKQIRYFEIDDYLKNNNATLLDVRTADEHQLGIIPGSRHIDLEELRGKLDQLSKDKIYIIYCRVGLRGYIAYRILTQNGFKAVNLEGGYQIWEAVHYQSKTINKSMKEPDNYCQNEGGASVAKIVQLDACGLQCPGPILKTKQSMDQLTSGEQLEIKATDPGFKKDIAVWAERTGNVLKGIRNEKGIITATIEKGGIIAPFVGDSVPKNRQTVVVFSGDLDKVLASFIIANGALAMGKEVSMFFTFWGLNALRRSDVSNKNKPFIEKMFGFMMPKGSRKLKLSQMNMGGMGTAMMKRVMKHKNVDSLESLMTTFLENGGKIIACTMSMDLMGITESELIKGIEYGGVATYLGDAQDAYSNLFI